MNIRDVNKEIIQVWKDFPELHDGIGPELVSSLTHTSLLFVGLNPAFNEKWISKLLKNNNKSETNPSKYFAWSTMNSYTDEVEKLLNYQTLYSKSIYSYFKKFEIISNILKQEWQHIDLFYYRETNQKELLLKIRDKGKLNEFGKRQIKIAGVVIQSIMPEVIVVVNAFASQIVQEYYKDMGFDSLIFNEIHGFHLLSTEKKTTPIFFSGMLTGQRALDLGSLQRLEWHIEKALKIQK